MDNSTPTLQQLQDDIDLYQALIASCDDQAVDADMQENKEYWESKIAELRAQCSRIDPSPAQRPASGNTPGASGECTGQPEHATPDQHLSLPSRKRDRGEFDDDFDADGMHRFKSRRSTPAESPAQTEVDSIGSDYFDNPELTSILGSNLKEARDRAIEQERRRRQEEEDERLARQLQEQWRDELPQSSSQNLVKHASHTQATFRPNGSFGVPAPSPPTKSTIASATGGRPSGNLGLDLHDDGSPDSPSTDDSVSLVNRDAWYERFPFATAVANLATSLHPSQSPGTSAGSPYTSVPGTSVYINGQPGPRSKLEQLQSLAQLHGIGMPGSLGNPLDVENFLGSSSFSLFSRSWGDVPDSKETQEEIRQLLNNIRPDEEIDPAEARRSTPQGLNIDLMPHQVKGLAWMKQMEDGGNKGGILADDMGLGKTIQAIALMLSRPPPVDARKPTLIVCPVALMEQWKREIQKHVKPRHAFTVTLLHGTRAHVPWNQVKHFDVVLTSYGTLTSELKRKISLDEKLKLKPDYKKTKRDECPLLDDRAKFHRVFLDEAQNIKNKNTRSAAAACRVNAEYRWCLSGTPMQNNVDEIYSLIRFCRIRPYNSPERFAKDITRPLKSRSPDAQDGAMRKLQALLKAILLRRTKKSEIDGKPILQLPEKHIRESRAVFDEGQLHFYKALETQSRIQFNRFIKDGRIGQNYSRALVLLLRLRQCCCSPQLVTNSADFVVDSGVEGIDLVENARALPEDVIRRLHANLEESKESDTGHSSSLECPVCMDAVDNPIIFNPCGHALCHDCFSRMVDNVHQENANDVKCPHCRAKIDTKRITDLDSFNEVHGDGQSRNENLPIDTSDSSEDSDESSDTASDDEVESDGSDDGEDLRNFVVNDDESLDLASGSDDDDLDRIHVPKQGVVRNPLEDVNGLDESDLDRVRQPNKQRARLTLETDTSNGELDFFGRPKTKESEARRKGKTKKHGKKKDKMPHKSLADLRKEGLKSRAAKRKYLRQLGKIYEPCAKIDKTLELLQEIQDRGEGEKTIVFSSFTSFLDLLEVPLSQNRTLANYTRYDGSMTAKDRNHAVLRFTDDVRCQIILVSLKAGNAGLNLTAANHVILLDPFWNPFVEYQAADRCHRIGQQREVFVHRVLIGEEGVDHEADPEHIFTVEDRILQLQEKKRKLVESALDENAASSVSRLGTRELGYLFGVNDMPARNGV